jgi:hypothetical protein
MTPRLLHSVPVPLFGPLMENIEKNVTIASEAHRVGQYIAARDALREILASTLRGQKIVTDLRKSSGQ